MPRHHNWTYLLVAAIVRIFMVGAAAISFMHIVATSRMLGLSWEAWTVPGFVDGLAILGLVGRSDRFAAATQRAGLALMAGAGSLSLACNVYAGHNLGQQLYGVLVVAGFITAEWYSMRLRPAPARAAKSTARSDAAKKAAATRATRRAQADAEKAAAAERRAEAAERRRLAREVAGLEASFAAAAAPVSPAPGEAAAYL